MKEIAIVILMVCILNTVLLLAHMHSMRNMHKHKQENFDEGPSYTYVGDYVSGFSRHGVDRRVAIKRNNSNSDQVIFQ